MNTTFLFLVQNGWTRKPCTGFLGWEVCQASEAGILNKSRLAAELLVKCSQKSWEKIGSMPPYGSQQQPRARGKTNSCWGWRPQNSNLGQEPSCSLFSKASDHVANRVPGNYTSLRSNSRWLWNSWISLRLGTKLWVVNSPERRGALCQHTDSCRKRTGW